MRAGLTALAAAMTVTAVVPAAGAATKLPYKTGAYGVVPCAITTNRECSSDDNGVVKLTVSRGAFKFTLLKFTDSCDNGARSFTEPVTFKAGANAKLAGKISSTGRFSGAYTATGTTIAVSGTVKGRVASVTVREHGTYTKENEAAFTCSASVKLKAYH
jgi:hypothetical protein